MCQYSMSSKSSKNTRKTCQSVHLPFCSLCLVILQRLITMKNIEYVMKLRFFSLFLFPPSLLVIILTATYIEYISASERMS